jgi:hypothetical protein
MALRDWLREIVTSVIGSLAAEKLKGRSLASTKDPRALLAQIRMGHPNYERAQMGRKAQVMVGVSKLPQPDQDAFFRLLKIANDEELDAVWVLDLSERVSEGALQAAIREQSDMSAKTFREYLATTVAARFQERFIERADWLHEAG